MAYNSAELIDIVYLWVNGADPVWRHKRQQALLRQDARQHTDDLARYGEPCSS